MESRDKPKFLSEREWQAVLSINERNIHEPTIEEARRWAALDMGIEEHSLENLLSRIRRKIRETRKELTDFNKQYKKIIKPLR